MPCAMTASATTLTVDVAPQGWAGRARGLLPGLGLCGAVTLAAAAGQALERRAFNRPPLEALVLAILLGAAVRTAWTPGARWRAGVEFAAKTLLEVAVVLLGASVSAAALASAGPALLGGVAAVVALSIVGGYGVGRLAGLHHRMALLVACGNSICGNSAIAAVAPVIGADGEEVAASIAFTAVLGVAVVLGLPHLGHLLHLGVAPYGVLAGLTVYAVPQVLAAAAPYGPAAVQLGALVKLVRVLALGPVCLALSLLTRADRDEPDEAAPAVTAGDRPRAGRQPLHQLLPWFILGFLALAGARALGVLPTAALAPAATASSLLTVVAMAALGLGVDLRVVGRAGPRVTAVVVASLALLGVVALGLIRLLGLT